MMNCEFKYLYFANDGYVIRCTHCHHYQVAFMCICLTLNEEDYHAFRRIVHYNYTRADDAIEDYCKCIVIKTPAEGISFILSKYEVKRLHEILERADDEAKALSLIGLFNP